MAVPTQYQIKELKERGHELIEDVVALGVHRTNVYRQLSQRLGVRLKYAHFHLMRTAEECDLAIFVLEDIRFERQERLKRRRARVFDLARKNEYKKAVYTNKELLQEVGRRNRERIERDQPTKWWGKLRAMLFSRC